MLLSKCDKLSETGWTINQRVLVLTKTHIGYYSKVPKILQADKLGQPK